MKIVITEEQYNNLISNDDTNCVSPKYVIRYIKEITPNKEDIPFHFLQMIRESNTRFCLKNVNIEELLNSDNDLREYVINSDSRYEDDEEVDVNDMFQPIVVLNGECLDGYSRVKGHIDNGETHIEGYVG
jgi:hypothetical protein